MQYLSEFLTVVVVHLLAVMSPGPDFAMIVRNSFVYSRKTGIYSAIGLGFGIMVHVAYSLIGVGLLIAKSVVVFSVIKYLGAAYLIYIGVKSLLSKKQHATVLETQHVEHDITRWSAVRIGFLTNVLNPKATLFILSLFTQVISPGTPVGMQVVYGVWMSGMTFVWFTLLSIMVSHPVIKKRFGGIQQYVERSMGAVLIALGIKVALSSTK